MGCVLLSQLIMVLMHLIVDTIYFNYTHGIVGLVTVAITGLAVGIGSSNGNEGQKNQGNLMRNHSNNNILIIMD